MKQKHRGSQEVLNGGRNLGTGARLPGLGPSDLLSDPRESLPLQDYFSHL